MFSWDLVSVCNNNANVIVLKSPSAVSLCLEFPLICEGKKRHNQSFQAVMGTMGCWVSTPTAQDTNTGSVWSMSGGTAVSALSSPHTPLSVNSGTVSASVLFISVTAVESKSQSVPNCKHPVHFESWWVIDHLLFLLYSSTKNVFLLLKNESVD